MEDTGGGFAGEGDEIVVIEAAVTEAVTDDFVAELGDAGAGDGVDDGV